MEPNKPIKRVPCPGKSYTGRTNEPKGCAMPGCCAAADEIATLRAEVERRVKEIAHLKLAAEKAERERDDA